MNGKGDTPKVMKGWLTRHPHESSWKFWSATPHGYVVPDTDVLQGFFVVLNESVEP